MDLLNKNNFNKLSYLYFNYYLVPTKFIIEISTRNIISRFFLILKI